MVLGSGGAVAQRGSAPEPPRTVRALVVSSPIDIDGRLDEPVWATAPAATGFVQREPVEGAPAEHDTDVRILFDAGAIYIGVRLHDPEPHTIARQLVRRDQWGQYDYFEVGLDPNRDRRTGYLFRVSAANVQRDEYLYDDNEEDEAWDATWSSAVQIDGEGWTAELRIPLSQLRYEASADEQTWGVNFARYRLRSNETSMFSLISRLQEGIVSQFVPLEGIQLASASRRIEMRPYVLSQAWVGPAEIGNPFTDGSDVSARTGIDIRYGLGAQFTLDATINPDFGQVEADPAVINLTAFEQFFEERRPFFVEDARVFDFSLSGRTNRLFYSRRIGRTPHSDAPDGADFADVPDAASILGAAKLTGRTAGGLSVGALVALTDREKGRAYFADVDEIRSFRAEPRSEFGVFRLQQDFNDGASTIGGIATLMHRDLPGDRSFDFLPSNAISAGLDWEHQWGDRTWAFFGYLSGSHVRGDSVAMIRLQRASNHFFQRPDSRWLEMDSSATSLTGIDWRMTFERRRGDWTGSIWAAQVTSGYEVNDAGFSTRQEVLDGGFRIGYLNIEPGPLFRSYSARFWTFHNWSHDALRDPWSTSAWGRAHMSGSFNLNLEAELLNNWEVEASVNARPETMDRTATRGGPLMLAPRSVQAELGFQTDRRHKLSIGPSVMIERRALDAGSELQLSAEIELRPSSNVEIEVEPEWSRGSTGAQYIGTTRALPFSPTFGARYVFARLERRELGLETRVNVAFSPHLSLQIFAQPLLSSGDYTDYLQLLAPETFSFDTFADGSFAGGACAGGRTCVDGEGRRLIDFDGDGQADFSFRDRDFNVRSLIGNAVLRWEYRPGSTLFLVWQRRQEDELRGTGNFRFRRDADALFAAPAENIFMIKLNYWLSL